MELDERILNFRDENIRLPKQFRNIQPKRIIYAAGDVFGGPKKNLNDENITNIEAYSKLGYNIFCCTGMEDTNISYLMNYPELNIVLCILTGTDNIDYPILERLFKNSIDEINTDDTRFYPSAKTCFILLKTGGVCKNVSIPYQIAPNKRSKYSPERFRKDGDMRWGFPNFIQIEKKGHNVTFEKNGDKFDENAKYINNSQNNISRIRGTYTGGKTHKYRTKRKNKKTLSKKYLV